MEYLLEVQHLNKNLNTFALHDISFTLKPGFITGLIGQNGCGKTSTDQNYSEFCMKKIPEQSL